MSSGATTVGLNSVAGYANGEIAVFVIDPSNASKQTFTGVIDTSGVQVTSVVWTAGSNTTHASGATVVDYATATHISMMTKGILVQHKQDGTHANTITTDTINENTAANGITIDGLNIKDSKLVTSDSVVTANITNNAVTPAKWTNPYCFRAYNSVSVTLTDATNVKITLGAEAYDYNSNFNTTTSTYTAPVAGVYHFDAKVKISSGVSAGLVFTTFLYVNGASAYEGGLIAPGNFAATIFTADILLAANDTVELYAHQDSGGSEATETGNSTTYFNGHLVHKV